MTRRRLCCTVVVLLGVLLSALGASTAAAKDPARPVTGLGVRLVDVPTATADDPRARSYIVDHLRPGTTIERRIEVVNGTRSTAHVSLYPAAATVGKTGFVGEAGHSRNQLSTWTTTTPQALVLTPAQHAFVKVTVRVPALAVRGETYGVVWAEMRTTSRTGGGITQVSRVGIRQYLSVGAGGAPPTDFKVVSLTAVRDSHHTPIVEAAITNTGQRAIDLTGTLSLTHGPGGLSAGPFPMPAGTSLAIGDTQLLRATLDAQIPNGPWLAKVSFTSGVTTRTSQATLTFPAKPGKGPVVTGSTPFHLTWLTGTAAGLALLLVVLAVIYLAKRRRSRTREQVTP